MLTDVRFKLLGLVPAVSVVVLISLFGGEAAARMSPIVRTMIAVFGLLATGAFWIYEQRNDQFYNGLADRARKIEEELGIDTGQFRGRLRPFKRYLIFPVDHSFAINTIYGIGATVWLLAVVAIWLSW
jgi:hypothetical protein